MVNPRNTNYWKMTGVLLALITFGVAAIWARAQYEVENYFYSDNTFTDQVGYRIVPCTGSIYREGQFTNYSVSYRGEQCSSGTGSACIKCFAETHPGDSDYPYSEGDPYYGQTAIVRVECPLYISSGFGADECQPNPWD